ncbi:MAG TPA: tetratricopeptide repeat protein [Candidatus Magasanikbacteria bacterium]|nr:tetratricopeptide repeat protein [Candidatus Magasanikbacteria bacterium]
MILDRGQPGSFEPPRESGRVPFFGNLDVRDRSTELDEESDSNKILENFSDLRVVENMVVQKGSDGEYLGVLSRSFDKLLRASAGKEIGELNADDMRMLVDNGLPPLFFSELAGVYFHQKNDFGNRIAGMLVDENGFGSNVALANGLNCLASFQSRRKQHDVSRELNRHGLEIIKEENSPEAMWQRMKIEHGLVDARSRGVLHADMVGKFEDLLRRRVELGDNNHIGRTELEIARLCLELGDFGKALHFVERALASATSVRYANLIVDTELLEVKIRRAMGDYRGSRNYFLKADESGRDLGPVREPEIEEAGEDLEKYKASVFCAVQFPNGKYLTSISEDGTANPVLVELANTKNVEGGIREGLEKLLNSLRDMSGLKGEEGVSISVRNTRLKFQYKENVGTEEAPHRNIGYGVFLPETSQITELCRVLDKNSILGYGITDSWSESPVKE